ncbi:MAG: hypothetical protein AB7O28_12240 [Vicinamibacterales bacterium]
MPRLSPLIAVIALSVGAPAAAQDKPPTSRLVALSLPHVAKRGSGHVLAQTVTTTSGSTKDKFWTLVEMDGPDPAKSCDWVKAMDAKQSVRFECPLTDAAGQKFTVRVRVFTDAKLEDRHLFYEPEFTITQGMLDAATDAPSGEAPAPVGVFEGMDTPLPATFKPTWYRRVDKGFGMRAYQNSGDFTATAEGLSFVDGKMTVTIPKASILSVRWEPLPNDIANHWVVVRYTTAEGKEDGVAFRDGGRMGTRGNTGPIFLAARKVAAR